MISGLRRLGTAALCAGALAGITYSGAPTERWTYSAGANNEFWAAQDLALGDYAGQVFVHFGFGDPTRLFSSYDRDAAQPAWTYPNQNQERPMSLDSAAKAPVHATVTMPYQQFDVQLRRYNPYSANPLTNTLPRFAGNAFVRVTPDGERVVASTYVGGGLSRVEVFDSTSPTSLYVRNPDTRGQCIAFEIDDAATTLMAASSAAIRVFDLNSGALLHAASVSGTFFPGDLSPDGLRYAFEKNGTVETYRRSGSTYVLDRTYSHGLGGGSVVLKFSGDGSTLCFGFTSNDARTVVVRTLDVQTGAVRHVDTVQGSASGLTNILSGIAISDKGDRVALGVTGDNLSLPEISVYSIGQFSVSEETINGHGSCMAVDLSGDGKRLVASFKDTHSTLFSSGSGSEIVLYDLEPRDFDILGIPRQGTIQIEMFADPGQTAHLLSAREHVRVERLKPRFGGILYPRRSMLEPLQTLQESPYGSGRYIYTMFLSGVGTEKHMQGLASAPLELTDSWAKVTVLP